MITFPERAKVGWIVAKENFYGKINMATKNLFQSEIARIIWEHKLAPDTINLPAKKWPEIEVFRIVLKSNDISEKVLKVIDSAIPYPILFIIEKGTVEKAAISYKEQGQKDENSAKVDTYFATEWNDEKLKDIRIDGLDIDTVFSNFIRQVAGDKLTNDIAARSEQPKTIKEDVDELKVHGNIKRNVGALKDCKDIKEEVDALKECERIQKQIDALTRKINAEPSLGKRQELAEERWRLKRLL